jgi:hypothetical protein
MPVDSSKATVFLEHPQVCRISWKLVILAQRCVQLVGVPGGNPPVWSDSYIVEGCKRCRRIGGKTFCFQQVSSGWIQACTRRNTHRVPMLWTPNPSWSLPVASAWVCKKGSMEIG